MQPVTRNRLRLALQKSGRLSEDCFKLLNQCGIKISKRRMKLLTPCENFPLDLLLVRDDDIPSLVMDKVCDLGIVGTNVLQEACLQRQKTMETATITTIRSLDFGRCRLAIAVPENFNFLSLADLANKKIATSYPSLLKQFLNTQQINAQVITLTGSVEIAPHLAIADAICDLVSTGATLEANGLVEVATIFSSQAVLVGQPSPVENEKSVLVKRLLQRIDGVLQASNCKYIMLHAPTSALPRIIELLPGAEKPTIVPLAEQQEKMAVHALCKEHVFWETMEKLQQCGASSILVLPVEKILL